jgi:hypothetical protein
MARARNIKPGFFLNDLLAEIEPLGRLLFAGLWTIADREGRLEDRPKKIKAAVLPYDDCDVDHLLNELSKRDFIIRYEVNGEKYIQIVKWEKHQNPHYKEVKSEIPPYINHNENVNQTKKKVTTKAKKQCSNVKPTLTQHQAELEPTLNQHQTKINSSLHADSLNLIPDSFNSINTADEKPADFEFENFEDETQNNKSPSQVIALTIYKHLKNIGIKKNSKWVGKQIGLANDLLKRYSFDEINKVIEWGFSDSFYRKIFNGLEKYDQILQAMKGGDNHGRSRIYQQPDRKPPTAEDYDEPEYRDLIRASDRKLEKLGVFKVSPGDQELP